MLIKKCKNTGLNHFNNSKAFIEYSNDVDDIYKIIEEYNPIKRKILIKFDDMITDMLSNKKKRDPVVTELFIIYY